MSIQHPTPIRLAAYADGGLESRAAHVIERHVQRCPRCQAELAGLQALSLRLQEFALPHGLGVGTWERVQRRLPERDSASRSSFGRALRWLPPVGLVASNVMLQAALAVALGLWALSSLGWFDWQLLLTGWLPSSARLPGLPTEDFVGHVVSWLLSAPLGASFASLVQASGVDIGWVLSWLVPAGLVLAVFASLSVLYLGWLLAYWSSRTRVGTQAVRAG